MNKIRKTEKGIVLSAVLFVLAGILVVGLISKPNIDFEKINSYLFPKRQLTQEEINSIQESVKNKKVDFGNLWDSLSLNFIPNLVSKHNPNSNSPSDKKEEQVISDLLTQKPENDVVNHDRVSQNKEKIPVEPQPEKPDQLAEETCSGGKTICNGSAVYYCFDSGDTQKIQTCSSGCSGGKCK